MRLSLVVLASLFLAGCSMDLAPPGPTQRESKSIDRDDAELVKVDLNMGAGELRMRGGSKKLMDADFEYNAPASKPEVRYNNTGVRGYLTIAQPGNSRMGRHHRYTWDVRLSDEVPLDVNIHFGAGQATIDLGSVSLRRVEVNMGVGEIKLDLRGHPNRDYDVHVRGGVGQATVYLPSDAGLYADASGGIGGIKVSGLRKEGNHWVNDAYDKAKVKVHVDVRGGVGEIRLVAD